MPWSGLYDWIIKGGIGAVTGGLLVNELKRRIEIAGENRKYIGRVLCDLLEIRYYLAMTKMLRAEVNRLLASEIPQGQAGWLVHIAAQQFLRVDWSTLANRYNDAVTALAGIHPVLAYELRSKENIGPMLQQLGALATAQTNDPIETAQRFSFLAWLDQVLEKQNYCLDDLREAVLRVSRKHGLRTLGDSKRKLEKQDSIKITAEEQQVMNDLKARLQGATTTATAATGAAAAKS